MYKTYDDLPNKHAKKIAEYGYDYFFHHLLIHSEDFRLMLCRHLCHDQAILRTYIKNGKIYKPHYEGKKLGMDIAAVDDKSRYFNFEMQNSPIGKDDEIRFGRYLDRLMDRQS